MLLRIKKYTVFISFHQTQNRIDKAHIHDSKEGANLKTYGGEKNLYKQKINLNRRISNLMSLDIEDIEDVSQNNPLKDQ